MGLKIKLTNYWMSFHTLEKLSSPTRDQWLTLRPNCWSASRGENEGTRLPGATVSFHQPAHVTQSICLVPLRSKQHQVEQIEKDLQASIPSWLSQFLPLSSVWYCFPVLLLFVAYSSPHISFQSQSPSDMVESQQARLREAKDLIIQEVGETQESPGARV